MQAQSSRVFYIYCHTSPSGKRYIGQTCQSLNERWGNGSGYRNCRYFENAIAKYGWDNIRHDVLAVCHTKQMADLLEEHLIAFFDTTDKSRGYNLTKGGGGLLGYRFSDETRARLREKGLERGISEEHQRRMYEGRLRSDKCYGPMSDDQKQKISVSLKGRPSPMKGKKRDPEVVARCAAGHVGIKHSEETCRRKSESLRNSPKVEAKRRGVIQRTVDGEFVKRHEGIIAASRAMGVSKAAISLCCRGVCNTVKGYRWEYEDDALREQASLTVRERTDSSTIGLPVVQTDLDGNVIAEFNSTVDAANHTGIKDYNIAACCRGTRKTSGGFVWRYMKESADSKAAPQHELS